MVAFSDDVGDTIVIPFACLTLVSLAISTVPVNCAASMLLFVSVSVPSSVANCLVVALNLPLKTLEVVLYQISPALNDEGSDDVPVNRISAFVEEAAKLCFAPAEYVVAAVLSTISLPTLIVGLPLTPSPFVMPILFVVPVMVLFVVVFAAVRTTIPLFPGSFRPLVTAYFNFTLPF